MLEEIKNFFIIMGSLLILIFPSVKLFEYLGVMDIVDNNFIIKALYITIMVMIVKKIEKIIESKKKNKVLDN